MVCGDIDKVGERRKGNRGAREIRNDSERCNGLVEYHSVKFAEDVRAALVSRNDDEWAEIAGAHLAVKCLLDSGVADEYERTALEVEVANGCVVIAFKLDRSETSHIEDHGM